MAFYGMAAHIIRGHVITGWTILCHGRAYHQGTCYRMAGHFSSWQGLSLRDMLYIGRAFYVKAGHINTGMIKHGMAFSIMAAHFIKKNDINML